MAQMSGFFFQDRYFDQLKTLSDQELGRLVRALSYYHMTGETQELKGRESMAYEFIKFDIDEAEKGYRGKCETNRKNRMSSIDNERQRPLTTVNDRQQTTTDVPNINKKEININKNKMMKEEAEEESAPSPQQQPTASQNKTSGIGSADLFGEFLSDDFGNLENLHEAETLLKKYRMSVNDSNVERVVGWINSKGLKTVQDAFRKASDADNRGGLSMNFLDAVINNPSPSGNGTKTGSKWNGQDYTQRSAEERKAAFSAATVEL